ncbi:GPP34 family phosphoprotein [Micromonospora sp. WMMD964]|uniref:GPP34 family phosphoprotein n=1 Tax=Micromonospora sp. WMMD964 TaxID=3016091 RepID=UPI00249C9FD2|nr:GPP34 family phosphoprotein [Micromonospora sp. WMMD964]WFF00232.1 GPP34 family phosphoprotein [Micromonospora sp. WMMD964]
MAFRRVQGGAAGCSTVSSPPPRKVLGLFRTAVLRDGRTERRARLLAEVRQVLVDGAQPQARVAALTALLSASGTHRKLVNPKPIAAIRSPAVMT